MKTRVVIVLFIVLLAGLSLTACHNASPDTVTTPGLPPVTPHQTTSPVTGPIAHAITTGPDGAIWYTLTEDNKIGRLSPETGEITEYLIPTAMARPWGITAGTDGNLWFAETHGNKIGNISPETGIFTEYNLPTPGAGPVGITAGPDGNIWFTLAFADKIGCISPASGTITEYDIPTSNAGLYDGITAGTDGCIWFTMSQASKIGKLNPETGKVTEYKVQAVNGVNAGPYGITTGPDGYIWFTELNDNAVSKISTDTGKITTFPLPGEHVGPYSVAVGVNGTLWLPRYPENRIDVIPSSGPILFNEIPTASAGPYAITAGQDGNFWFTETYKNNIGKIGPQTGKIIEYSLHAGTPHPELMTSPLSTPLPEVLLLAACPYSIVEEELGVTMDDPTRSTARRSIVAEKADSFETLAATALQAAIDLYTEHGKDHTSVVVVPGEEIHVFLAQASFAADGKGAEGMTGSVPANPGYWTIRAADRTMTEQELDIAELWFAHMQDFPSKNPLSSLSYDKNGLCEFIAMELDIPVGEIDFPQTYFIENQHNYFAGEDFIEWSLALRD